MKAKFKGGLITVPMAASTTINKGDIVCINPGTGGAVQGANTSGYLFVGIAAEGKANSGSLADKYIKVYTKGLFLLTGGTLAVTANGATMYAVGAATVDETGSNSVIVGKLIKFVSATSGWVLIGRF
jgi:hypothetical protein